MPRTALAAVAALSLIGAVAASTPAPAAEYGAIAFDNSTGRAGWSINQPNPKRAEQVALSNCGGSDCKIVVRIKPHMCGAFARAKGKKHVGAAARRNRDEARLAALGDCKKGQAGECVIRFSECNR